MANVSEHVNGEMRRAEMFGTAKATEEDEPTHTIHLMQFSIIVLIYWISIARLQMSYTLLRMNKRQLNQTKHLLVIQTCVLSYSSTSIKGHKGPVQLLPAGHPCTLSMTSSPALPWLQRWWRVRHWANEYWEHTHTHTTLVAELWLPSGDDTALALHTELCATSTLTAMFVPFYYEYRPWCWQQLSPVDVLPCSKRASQQVIHPPSSTLTFRWRTINHITLPPLALRTCQQHPPLLFSSWWFTVLLHKLTVGISQCLNAEKPYYSQMRQGSCRTAVVRAFVVDFLFWRSSEVTKTRLSLSFHAGILI